MKILSRKPLSIWCSGGQTHIWTPESFVVHLHKKYRLLTKYTGEYSDDATTHIPGTTHDLYLLFNENLEYVCVVEDLDTEFELGEEFNIVHYASVHNSTITIIEDQNVCSTYSVNSKE